MKDPFILFIHINILGQFERWNVFNTKSKLEDDRRNEFNDAVHNNIFKYITRIEIIWILEPIQKCVGFCWKTIFPSVLSG